MNRPALLSVLLLSLAALVAAPAAAQDDGDAPPFPAYPDFRPDRGMGGDRHLYDLVYLDHLEVAPAADGVPALVEGFYRIGTDYHRLWLKAEAEGLLGEGTGEGEVQALGSRLISAYFEAVAGVRTDLAFGEGAVRARPQLAVGLEGLAPYWFEIEPMLFVSHRGDVSARFEASYDLLVTQRLVLQPDVEVNVALQEVEAWGVGAGLNDVELGFRLRYEIRREVAPYVGVSRHRRFAAAADFAEAEGERAAETLLVFGIRLWR